MLAPPQNVLPLKSYPSKNLPLFDPKGHCWVVKVSNFAESKVI